MTALIVLILSLHRSALGAELSPLLIAEGEQRVVHVGQISHFSVGGESVHVRAGLNEASENLMIKGVKPGVSDVWIWKKDGSTEHRTLTVSRRDSEHLSPALVRTLEGLEQTEILYSGDSVMLRGQIHSESELAHLGAITHSYPTIPIDVELDEALKARVTRKIEAWVQAAHLQDKVQVEWKSGGLRITGALEDPRDRESAEKKIRSIDPLATLDLESLPDRAPVIHFKVYLLELKKTRMRTLGVNWPAEVPNAAHMTTHAIQQTLALDLGIQALETEGSAKILSNPELVVRAPGEAELFAGGEIPIKTMSHFDSQVTWKNFGLTLRLKVTHMAGSNVRLEIFTEVSHLDTDLSHGDIPGLQANRMKTQVDAKFDHPLMLSGLLQQTEKKQAHGLPFLRQIPVLGALFGSDDFLNDRSELVAILLPSAEPPPAQMGRVEKFQDIQPEPKTPEHAEPPSTHSILSNNWGSGL